MGLDDDGVGGAREEDADGAGAGEEGSEVFGRSGFEFTGAHEALFLTLADDEQFGAFGGVDDGAEEFAFALAGVVEGFDGGGVVESKPGGEFEAAGDGAWCCRGGLLGGEADVNEADTAVLGAEEDAVVEAILTPEGDLGAGFQAQGLGEV